MARQIEAAFKEYSEQIDQADLLKMTNWYIEFGFNGKEDTSTKTRRMTYRRRLRTRTRTRKLPICQIRIGSSMILCKQIVINFLSNIAK